MINVKGTLTDPVGNPSVDTLIRFASVDNSGETIGSLRAGIRTGADGSYDFSLVTGKYEMEVLVCNKLNLVATIQVADQMTGVMTLQELIATGLVP